MTDPPATWPPAFAQKVRIGEGCWEWTGGSGPLGYGRFYPRDHGRCEYAHRWSWILANGPIPVGLCVCHRCDNRGCVRPDHLYVGTRAENNRECRAKGRGGSRWWRNPVVEAEGWGRRERTNGPRSAGVTIILEVTT